MIGYIKGLTSGLKAQAGKKGNKGWKPQAKQGTKRAKAKKARPTAMPPRTAPLLPPYQVYTKGLASGLKAQA